MTNNENAITPAEAADLKAKLENLHDDRSFDDDATYEIEELAAFLEFGPGRGRAEKAQEIQAKYSS